MFFFKYILIYLLIDIYKKIFTLTTRLLLFFFYFLLYNDKITQI